jgi:tRNA(Ile)-lysidine synthase
MMNLHPTERLVLATIRDHEMMSSGARVIVAVSGGPDSVCLLEILVRLRETLKASLIVAHLDHGLRPGEDERETEFVETLARRLEIPCACERASQLVNARGTCLEERARELRYRFFEGVLSRYHAQRVALGHNKNDQVETVVMNMLRGTGSAGLSGMPPVRENRYIRPLIHTTREEILAYLRERDLPYMTDSSNLETKYLRNRIRLELMPMLLTYQPRLIDHLGDLAFLCREENQFMEQEAEKRLQEMIMLASEQAFDISIDALKGLPVALKYRVIRGAIRRAKGDLRRVDLGHIRAIVELIAHRKPQARINLPGHIVVKKRYDKLQFCAGEEKRRADFSYPLEGPGRFHLEAISRTITCEEISRDEFKGRSPSDWQCFLDLETLRWPLILRNFRLGDRFMPLGLNGFKKLKDLFIDNRIPHEQRKMIPILESHGNIVWVGGIRIDHRYRVRKDTRRILRCTIE